MDVPSELRDVSSSNSSLFALTAPWWARCLFWRTFPIFKVPPLKKIIINTARTLSNIKSTLLFHQHKVEHSGYFTCLNFERENIRINIFVTNMFITNLIINTSIWSPHNLHVSSVVGPHSFSRSSLYMYLKWLNPEWANSCSSLSLYFFQAYLCLSWDMASKPVYSILSEV